MWQIILYLLIGAIFSAIIFFIREFLVNITNKIIELILDKLSLKKALYKKKCREYAIQLEELIEQEPAFRRSESHFTFDSKERNEELSNWRIIKIDKSLNKERIEQSVILQLPSSSKLNLERQLLKEDYKKGLFLALSKIIAEDNNLFSLVNAIDKKIEDEKVDREYQIFYEILRSPLKKYTLREEARRKWNYLEGKISKTAKNEFSKFIDDLKDGHIGVVVVSRRKPNEAWISDVQSKIKTHDIVYIYARGNYVNYLNKILPELKARIKLKREENEYDWEDEEGNIKYKAKTVIFRRS